MKDRTPAERIIDDAVDAAFARGKPLVVKANPSVKEVLQFQRAVRRRSIKRVVEAMKNKGQP